MTPRDKGKKRMLMSNTLVPIKGKQPLPRSGDGELVVHHRKICSGRAMYVSTMEWSVVERSGKDG